jgi:hypothetical protein
MELNNSMQPEEKERRKSSSEVINGRYPVSLQILPWLILL